MAKNRIGTRSPQIHKVVGSANDTTRLEVFVYKGHGETIPSLPTYTLNSVIPSSIITDNEYNISNYVNESFTHGIFIPVAGLSQMSNTEYLQVKTVEYLNGSVDLSGTNEAVALASYGTFIEGANPSPPVCLLDEGEYDCHIDSTFGALCIHDDGDFPMKVIYTDLSNGNTIENSLVYELNKVPYITPAYQYNGNKLEVYRNSVVIATYIFNVVCEDKYPVQLIDFVNKHGAWQRVPFFKASITKVVSKSKKYNLMGEASTYDPTANKIQIFNPNMTKNVTVNSGWVLESFSSIIEDLMLSTRITLNSQPVNLSTNAMELQTNLNDKTINYKLRFEFANHQLNYNS